MDALRLRQLSQMAETDDDIRLQLESEVALDPDIEAENDRMRFMEWIEEEGRRYLAPKEKAPDPDEIEKLVEDIDF